MIPRSPYLVACNDNLPAVDVTRITMVGFAISLVVGIVAAALVVCGVLL